MNDIKYMMTLCNLQDLDYWLKLVVKSDDLQALHSDRVITKWHVRLQIRPILELPMAMSKRNRKPCDCMAMLRNKEILGSGESEPHLNKKIIVFRVGIPIIRIKQWRDWSILTVIWHPEVLDRRPHNETIIFLILQILGIKCIYKFPLWEIM